MNYYVCVKKYWIYFCQKDEKNIYSFAFATNDVMKMTGTGKLHLLDNPKFIPLKDILEGLLQCSWKYKEDHQRGDLVLDFVYQDKIILGQITYHNDYDYEICFLEDEKFRSIKFQERLQDCPYIINLSSIFRNIKKNL